MMEYLKTLGVSELINFLEVESDSDNFDKVGEILLSRETNMTKHAENLEKNLENYKSKCAQLSVSLEEAKKKCVVADGKVEELMGYKILSDKLKEKVSSLERECSVVIEREKKVVQNVCNLSIELGKISKKRNDELVVFERCKESMKQKAESEIEEEKNRYRELEKLSEQAIAIFEKDLEACKAKCSDLGTELQEEKEKTKEVKGRLHEFKKYKRRCNELEEKVTVLEEECKVVTEREKKALENVTTLSADLEKMSRKRNVELGEFKRNMECVNQKAENELKNEKKRYTELENKSKDAIFKLEKDLEIQKQKCSELSSALEEKEKKNIELQSQLEEFKDCEITCGQLKEKVTYLEEKCITVSEREKAAIDNNTALLAALEKVRRDSDAEITELKTKNSDLECAKLKADDELKDRMEIIKELEKLKGLFIDVEKDLEMYKAQCSELSTRLEEEKQHSTSLEVKLEEFEKYKKVCNELKEKVSQLEEDCKIVSEREKSALDRITNLTSELEKTSLAKTEELNELEEKNKDLDCAKRKAENDVKALKGRYKKLKIQLTKAKEEIPALVRKSPVPAKANSEVAAESKEGEIENNKQGIIESEANGPLSAANGPKLKIKLKDLSFECDGKVRDHVHSDSVCKSLAKASGSQLVPVSTFKRKRTSTIRKCDGGGADQVGIGKVKTDHNKAMVSGTCEGKKRKIESNPSRLSVINDASNKKSGSPAVENSQEKTKTVERQSKRTIHPPVRLNL